jgi:hypothetical protein
VGSHRRVFAIPAPGNMLKKELERIDILGLARPELSTLETMDLSI